MRNKLLLFMLGLVVMIGAWAGLNGTTQISQTVQATTTPVAQSKTTTTTLPSHSSNAWDIPRFELDGLDGNKHSLDEWKGQVIVFNFWASWCSPCQYEIRDLIQMQKEYGDQGLQVIGVGVDIERKLRNVHRTLGINYPVLVADPAEHSGLLTDWGNTEQIIPYTVIIDSTGHIQYIHRGQMSQETFRDYVLPLLKS